MRRPGAICGAAALLALITVAALVVGCSNTASPEEDADTYTPRTSPANVVAKLVETYEAMDADAFIDCLADSFEFWLNPADLNDPNWPLPDHWVLDDESTIAENMLGPGTNVESIQLTLTLLGNPVEIPTPGGGESSWRCVYSTDLFVYLPNDLTLWANAAEQFTISVDPDATSPTGGTLWEIVKWEDIDGPARSENTTWGAIKSIYWERADERIVESTWGGVKALYR